MERVPSLFFAPAPKPGSDPDALAPAPPTPIPGVGDSPWTRGPQAKQFHSCKARSCSPSSRERAPTPPLRQRGTPRPLESPLTPTHHCQNAPPPTNGVCNPSREPPHLPFALGQSPPLLKRWSPSRGFHPEAPTGGISSSQAASPPPPRSRRRRRGPPQLLSLPPPPPHPGSTAGRPAPFSFQPPGRRDPRPGLGPN